MLICASDAAGRTITLFVLVWIGDSRAGAALSALHDFVLMQSWILVERFSFGVA